jgi:hypothetical protein
MKKNESIQDVYLLGTHLLTILFKPAIALGAACDATDCSPLSAAQNTEYVNNAQHIQMCNVYTKPCTCQCSPWSHSIVSGLPQWDATKFKLMLAQN